LSGIEVSYPGTSQGVSECARPCGHAACWGVQHVAVIQDQGPSLLFSFPFPKVISQTASAVPSRASAQYALLQRCAAKCQSLTACAPRKLLACSQCILLCSSRTFVGRVPQATPCSCTLCFQKQR